LVLSTTPNTPVDQIESELGKAINLSPADTYYNALYQLNFARAQSVAQSTTGTAADNQQAFKTDISNSIAAAQTATSIAPNNYENWVVLGSLYEALVPAPLSVNGAYDAAKAAYTEAQKRNPESPEPLLLMARLEYDNKNIDGARDLINQALAKKQDYADAYFLLTQLEAGANNTDKAISAAEAGAILSPDNAGIFFELGLLQYSKKDYTDAANAFSKAISIVPNYANAQYFLGLSEEYLGKHDEAIAQFESLAKSNPDNQDVQSILANLQAGKDPFYQSPSSLKNPEKRPTPPITSQP
jgi:tetratricopeptide (TPR) repeat protein